MMSQTGVIVRRNGGQLIPNAYGELAIQNNPKGWGAAIVTGGELLINHGEAESWEFFQTTMKEFMDDPITFYFAGSDAALNMENVSPYPIIEKEGKVLLAGFVEGNFPTLAKKESSRPPEFFVANELLIPKLQDVFEMVDGDLDKLMQFADKPHFKKDLLLQAVSRGTITLVAANGKSLTYSIGDTMAEYPWGWVSNNYGYAAGNGGPKKEDEKPKSAFPKRSTVREKASVPPSGAIAGSEAVTPPKTDTAISAIKNYTVKRDRPAAGASRSERKEWYKVRIGYCPPGWEKNVPIEFYHDPQGKLLTYAAVKKMGLDAAGLPKLNNPDRNGKDVEPDNIKQPDVTEPKKEEPKVTQEILPLMSPQSREKLQRFLSDAKVQKLIADNAEIISDPSKVQGIEEKFAHFSKQLGLKDDKDLMALPYEAFRQMNDADPRGFELWAFNMRNEILSRRLKAAGKEVSEQDDTTKTVEKPAEQKRSAFPKRNAA